MKINLIIMVDTGEQIANKIENISEFRETNSEKNTKLASSTQPKRKVGGNS